MRGSPLRLNASDFLLYPTTPVHTLVLSEYSLSATHFSHSHLPVALRRLGRAGRGVGEPGPAWGGRLSWVWWPPPRLSGGVWACPRLPTQAILGGSNGGGMRKRRGTRMRKEGGREEKGSRPSGLASMRQPQNGISSKIHCLNNPLVSTSACSTDELSPKMNVTGKPGTHPMVTPRR